jgi:tetratricopeptide (TPR) repeat protein
MGAMLFCLSKSNARALAGLIVLSSLCSLGWAQTSTVLAEITAALRSHDFDTALRLSEEALKRTPADVRLLTLRGLAYSGEGRSELALGSFQQALKLSPDYLPALEGAAQTEYQQGSAEAKPLLLRVLKLRPADPTTHAMLAVIEYKARNCPGAIEHFQSARSLLMNEPDALMEYGACLFSSDRSSEAIPLLQRALVLNSANPVVRYNLALVQWKVGQAEEALKTLSPLLDDASAPEDVLTLAADIHESRNDTEGAVELLRKAILAHPKQKAAYLQFASLSFDHASVEVGIDILNAGLAQLPNAADLYVARGVLLSKLSNSAQAMDDFETANRLDPDLSFAGAAAGIAESQAHKSDAALETFRVAAKQHPKDALTQYLLAEALSEQNKTSEKPDYTEEIAAAQRAVSLDPMRLDAHDLLASIYLQSDQTDLSLAQSEESLRIDPKDEQAIFHLMIALRKSGRKAEVAELVQRLVKVREENQTELKRSKRYRLVEGQASVPGGSSK